MIGDQIGTHSFCFTPNVLSISYCSSCSHAWDAFQLAHASFRLYCVRNDHVQSVKLGPRLLGNAPKVNIILPENEMGEQEGCSEASPAIKVYDEDVNMKFLVCGVPCTLVSLGSMPHLSHTIDVLAVPIDEITYFYCSIAGCMFVGLSGGWFKCSAEY